MKPFIVDRGVRLHVDDELTPPPVHVTSFSPEFDNLPNVQVLFSVYFTTFIYICTSIPISICYRPHSLFINYFEIIIQFKYIMY